MLVSGPQSIMSNDIMLPAHNGCFICDPRVPTGLKAIWYGRPDKVSAYGTVTLDLSHQGPPAHAHGGISASILDDILGACAWYAGHRAMTAKLLVNYRQPVPLFAELHVEGRVSRVDGRKAYLVGEIRSAEGKILVDAEALFVTLVNPPSETSNFLYKRK